MALARKRASSLDSEREREKLFLDVIAILLRYNDAEKRQIAEDAEVSWVTFYAWCSGKTIAPRISTLARVARVLGFEIVLSRNTKLPKPQRRLRAV